ncbi:hypothetical protein B0O99DRAFT_622575 [Bisporella sp. PMI_857]|nr:hypothetical protein B0O99DRAFT_622575 [Bisporella sp. PMI_857]
MTSRLLEEGRARVDETLHKGYAPSHFSHNLKLIFVEDSRSPASLSMKTKIASTGERSARLRTLEPPTLIWWAIAFPMRQWSGGRKMSGSTFDSLVRHAPRYAVQAESLLGAVADDLDRFRQKYPFCEMLQKFLNKPITHCKVISKDTRTVLSQQGRYINLSGARYDCLTRLPDLLYHGIEESRKYQEEKNNFALISTALEIFVPTDPNKDDAYALVPIGTSVVWRILRELGIVE